MEAVRCFAERLSGSSTVSDQRKALEISSNFPPTLEIRSHQRIAKANSRLGRSLIEVGDYRSARKDFDERVNPGNFSIPRRILRAIWLYESYDDLGSLLRDFGDVCACTIASRNRNDSPDGFGRRK